MSLNGEDDDIDDLEALRKAALATLKPKVQPIEQVISSGTTRNKTTEWSEVPASVDYPGFSDPVPEPSPYPLPHDVPAPQPNVRQPPPSVWPGHAMNGGPASRFRFQAFPTDRGAFHFHARAHHRSFGDRGRPVYDRGHRMRRGYIHNRGGIPLTSMNGPMGRLPVPALHHPNPAGIEQPIPAGGNLIFIQPHLAAQAGNSSHQNTQKPDNCVTNNLSNIAPFTTAITTTSSSQTPSTDSQKQKLVLPQDRYHSSQSSSQPKSEETKPEEPEKKPKDKFSRYDKSDSEDEDDWMDNHSEVDDIANEIDKFLQDSDEAIAEKEKDKTETAPEEPVARSPESTTEIDNLITDEVERVSHSSSPVPSEAESLDLDALANGDPVIGDFEDLDFLVDKEPSEDNVNENVKHLASDVDQSDIHSSEKDKEKSPVSCSSSPLSANYSSPRKNQDDHVENDPVDSKSVEKRNSPAHQLEGTRDKVSHTKSQSPVSNTSSRDRVSRSRGSRSPYRVSRPSYRSRSPIHSRTDYSRRPPPRRDSISPRRSPLRYRRSPVRGRSPRRQSLSPSRKTAQNFSSPRRISSPLRHNGSPYRRPAYARRSVSPRRRRQSPHSRSVSPHRTDRYRNDSRNRRNYQGSRRNEESLRCDARGSFSPPSRNHERGKWPESRGRTERSPKHGERGNVHGREDPAKGLFMSDKDLEKLPAEERAKIEARRKKFGSREEVKLEDAKKTVSLKSIKERKKKSKKNDKNQDDRVDAPLDDLLPKKSERSGISLKALRKKMELKKSKQEDGSSGNENVAGSILADLDDDSEDSDSGRAWMREGNKAKPIRTIKSDPSIFKNRPLELVDRYSSRSRRPRDQSRDQHPTINENKRPRLQRGFQNQNVVTDEDEDIVSDENIPSSHVGSSVVAASRFKGDIPPEKLRVQIQVVQKDKKKKKSKAKPDFSNIYSVPSKRGLIVNDDVDEEEDEEVVVAKKKAKKKDKKEKKKKSSKESHEDDTTINSADPMPEQSRPSILDRLGKKVDIDTTTLEKKKKKKKSKQGHLDNGDREDLDERIEKMKLKNAEIQRRQREIELDKERYG